MKARCIYLERESNNKLFAHVTVIQVRKDDPLVLNEYDRFSYYILGCMNWWCPTLIYVNKYLNTFEQLESNEIKQFEIYENDALIEITLEGAQASNVSHDSVTDQPEGRFTYEEVKTIFLKYKQFLEMPVSLETVLEFEL